MTNKSKDKKWIRVEAPPMPSAQSSEDFDNLDPNWDKADVTDFSGLNHTKTKTTPESTPGVNRATKRKVRDRIWVLVKIRRAVYDKSPELHDRPFEDVAIRDPRWQKAARKLHKKGSVKVPDELFHTPADIERLNAKHEEYLRIAREDEAKE
jgi:hypothetical protein